MKRLAHILLFPLWYSLVQMTWLKFGSLKEGWNWYKTNILSEYQSDKERILGTVYRVFRRYFYVIFKREYIRKQIKNRKGSCIGHGCCKTRIIHCAHFIKKTNECNLWKEKGYKALPYLCKISPFDEKDKTNFVKKNCNFYWNKSRNNKI